MGKFGKKEPTSRNSVNVNSPKHGFVQKKKNQKPISKVALINGSKTVSNQLQKQKENKELQKKDNVLSSSSHECIDEDLGSNNDERIHVRNPEQLVRHEDSKSSDDSLASIEEDSDDYESNEEVEMEEDEEVEEEDLEKQKEDEDEDDSEDENDNETNEEEEEEDQESESEEEAEESALGLKALLGSSIAEDDDDDEDFDEAKENDEDDDISSSEEEAEEEEEKVAEKMTVKKATEVEVDNNELNELKADKRTIFVGNLPKDISKKKLTKLFKQFGEIDTLLLRGKIAKDTNMSKKVAAIKNLHFKLKSVYAYIRYVSEESVKPALSMNNKEFEGNNLSVDRVHLDHDPKKSVFLGNLNFSIEDNAVKKHFEKCGDIESVHIIRDNKTGVGRGFGYVNFKTIDAVTLALKLDNSMLLNRKIRVKPNIKPKSEVKHGKRSLPLQESDVTSPKKSKDSKGQAVSIQNKKNAVERSAEKEKKQTSPQQKNTFQGQKAGGSKKKNKNKMDKKKKQLAEKLITKPKKSTN